jgi:hypothetical protein
MGPRSEVVGAFGAALVITLTACSGAPQGEAQSPGPGESDLGQLGAVAVDPVTDPALLFLEDFVPVAESYREYGSQTLTSDRSSVVIYWYGTPSGPPGEVIDEYKSRGLEVVVQQTPYLPGDVRDEADRIRCEYPTEVSGASPLNEYDGIHVTLNGAGGFRSEAEAELWRICISSRFPLIPDFTQPGPL